MKRGIFHPLSISALFYHVHFSLSRGKWTFRILFSIKRPMEPAPWAVFHILRRRRGDASFCSRSSHAPHGKARFPVHHNIVPDLGVLWIVMRKFFYGPRRRLLSVLGKNYLFWQGRFSDVFNQDSESKCRRYNRRAGGCPSHRSSCPI